MPSKELKNTQKFHPRNKHQGFYNFEVLVEVYPRLKSYVIQNESSEDENALTIDFSDAKAVKALNTALILGHYDLKSWDIPRDYLCPPVPGRADYIHHVADFIANKNDSQIPMGEEFICLDIGVGANSIYPIIGTKEYGWHFIGTDIDRSALDNVEKMIILNEYLKGKIELRHQRNTRDIFHSILKKGEHVDLTICNPPFHSSRKEATEGSKRKNKNLNLKETGKDFLNFKGQHNELICEGGEVRFIRNIIHQSKRYGDRILWFSSIVSKKDHLKELYKTLRKVETAEFKTVSMAQGNKVSRFIIWTFQSEAEQKDWMELRWNS